MRIAATTTEAEVSKVGNTAVAAAKGSAREGFSIGVSP
jgi:hypothetical protein